MNLSDIARQRYTTKRYDAQRSIPKEQIAQLETLLRLAPSSVNAQPWHFIVASSAEGRARIARATLPDYAYNEAKIRDASHVVVLCAKSTLDDAHLDALLAQETQDGRFPTPHARDSQNKTRRFYVDLHRQTRQDAAAWMDKQVYLALGALLFGAAVLQIDATPIEGFDAACLDAELGLSAQGWRSVVIASLGYRHADDANARAPKSRLPEAAIMTRI